MRRIFVDLEMNPVAKEYEEVKKTCSMETIEIGAVILDEDNREIASFREYIRPDYSADIRPGIQKLTGIVINAFTEPFVIPKELFDMVWKMPSSVEQTEDGSFPDWSRV